VEVLTSAEFRTGVGSVCVALRVEGAVTASVNRTIVIITIIIIIIMKICGCDVTWCDVTWRIYSVNSNVMTACDPGGRSPTTCTIPSVAAANLNTKCLQET
jgi:hypothetical protein